MILRCDVSQYKGVSYKDKDGTVVQILNFTVRETDGQDEARAAVLASAKGGAASSTEECIRLALVEVNGEPVNETKPYEGFDRWGSRARGLAIAAWRKLNSVSDKEAEDFLAHSVVVETD